MFVLLIPHDGRVTRQPCGRLSFCQSKVLCSQDPLTKLLNSGKQAGVRKHTMVSHVFFV